MSKNLLRLCVTLVAAGFLAAPSALGQTVSLWFGGPGNWSTPEDWCTLLPPVPPTPPPPCPPTASDAAFARSGAINLDVNATISSFSGTGSTTLTMNGTSLTTTGSLVAEGGSIEVDGGLQLSNGTINSADSLILGGSNNFTSSTVNTQNVLQLDGTLNTNNTQLTTPGSIIGNNGAGIVNAASTTWNTDLIVLGQNPGSSGQLTLDASSTVNLGNIGEPGATGSIGVGDAGQGTLTVNGGVINSLQPSFLSIGTNPSAPGNGQMSILEGGVVTVTDVLVGFGEPGTNATLTVDGQGSQLNLDGQVAGGGVSLGGGTVTVSNGAAVSGGDLEIAQGQVTVTSGGSWTVTGPAVAPDLTVGSFVPATGGVVGSTGVASLTVQGGATGSNQTSILIGSNAGSNGTMTISGPGSAWNSTEAVIVGVGGVGTLNLQESGVLTSGPGDFQLDTQDTSEVSGYVGQQSGSTGTVTIDGDGSAWNQTGSVHVGDAGTGMLTVQNGGALSTGSDAVGAGGVVGAQAGSQGTVTVTSAGSGSNSEWNSKGAVIVGEGGTGTLNLQSGGVLNSGPDTNGVSGYVGQLAGGTGTVTIQGSNFDDTVDSEWKQSGAIHVGDAGTGSITILDGASLTTGSDGSFQDLSGVVGVQTGGNGTVTINGDNSQWEADGKVIIGAAGAGTLNIQDQAEMNAGALTVGANPGGSGTVAMMGGTLDLNGDLLQNGALPGGGDLIVGDAGKGTFTIVPGTDVVISMSGLSDEGQINSANGIIGNQLGSLGSVLVGSSTAGAGKQPASSTWQMSGNLTVGLAGNGTLNDGGNVNDLQADIGQAATGNGTVDVGNNGMWSNLNGLIVGDEGIGNVAIETGGFVSVDFGNGSIIGNQAGSKGVIDVQGQLNSTQGLTIGASGTGILTVEAGGAIASGNSVIAGNAGSQGTVTVTGFSSSWAVDGTLSVGQGGTGTLTVSNGGQVSGGTAFIGEQAGSNGTVIVSNGGHLSNTDALIGQLAGSVGTVTISDSGSNWVVAPNTSSGSGTVNVGGNGSQGTLNVQNGGLLKATSVAVNPGGTLNGMGGTIVASVVNNGGVITPGDATGVMTVTGDYTQNSGTTLFEIDGGNPGQFDQLLVSGDVALNGGVLDITFGNSFAPTLGESFDLISALTLSDLGVTVDVTGLPTGFIFADDFASTGFDLVTEQTPSGAPMNTPEPSSWLLLGIGLISLLAHRKWRGNRASAGQDGRPA